MNNWMDRLATMVSQLPAFSWFSGSLVSAAQIKSHKRTNRASTMADSAATAAIMGNGWLTT